MSDRKLYSKKGTGTIPKIKHRNNTQQDDQFTNVLSNNLGDRYIRQNRNSRNVHQSFATFMESASGEQAVARQNGNNTSNGTSTPNTSRTNSRRNSVGTVPKCDNVTKYPDKKQIQTKLNQIQEYIRLTSSLMSNMNNTDEQSNDEMDTGKVEVMLKDLVDSESKLLELLNEIEICEANNENIEYSENGTTFHDGSHEIVDKKEHKAESESSEMQILKDQENLLLHLQLSAESQLREARLAQEKLSKAQNQSRHIKQDMDMNGFNDSIDAASVSGRNQMADTINDIEERLRGLGVENVKNSTADGYQNQIDVLQNKILQMRDGNDNRNQLIQMLDTQDAHLQAEHNALQGKLLQLQTQKMQIDQLVLQLQNLNEEEGGEEEGDGMMGAQVKSIVNMKEQLAKLKDMLHLVQNTESVMENQNVNEPDVEDRVRRLCLKGDNVLQNAHRSQDNNSSRSSRIENDTHSNEQRVKDKQVNKKSMNANERERIKLQAELQAKKRELEELMCKHKAATSNLNQDVNSENKSDLGICSNNPLYEGATNSWYPVATNIYNIPGTSERYSSDEGPEDDMNEYSEVNSSGDTQIVQPMPSLSYPTSNYIKRRDEEPAAQPDTLPYRPPTRTPERIVGSTTSLPTFQRDRTRSNNETSNKSQMQKQLELIKSVCDSMMDQRPPPAQLRNNLTPSPIYSEPRYASPHVHPMNTLNLVNPMEGMTCPINSFSPADGNYQSWLATNSLQTQVFILNTLNQCCQMLWLQQRELSTLRNAVNTMQERSHNYEPNSQYINSGQFPFIPNNIPIPNTPQSNNQYQRPSPPKPNPMVGGATSMPNLNNTHCPQGTNMDHACANHCNLQTARILDSALNNAVHNHGDHINNSMCHAVNQNIPSAQIWNGQALNNQVPPGNRANNYWDNFRSYSRQNLLSTKSNEGLQNVLTTERTNNTLERPPERVQQLGFIKLNTDHHEASSAASVENTPRRVLQMNQGRHGSVSSGNPPDVLNVNQLQKPNEPLLVEISVPDNTTECPFLGFNEAQVDSNFKERAGTTRRNRNEWHDDTQVDTSSPKSKLFEELRENVYKEVASLISANQGRPHFLIQLFRDLQLISSDPLRRRTLQSIQSVITSSLVTPGTSTAGVMRQISTNPHRVESEENLPSSTDFYDVHTFAWPQIPKSSRPDNEIIDSSSQEHLSEVLTFLNNHNEDIFSDSLVHSLKDTLVESTFSTIFTNSNSKDGIIQKHFASLLTEALEQYRGKKVQDVRINVLQTVEDLLRGEISLIRLMRENISESEMNSLDSGGVSIPQFDLQAQMVMDEVNIPQMQNGDLAEADQSRIELEEDDEGAVGGVLNILLERSSSSNAGQVLTEDEIALPKLDLVMNTESDVEFVEQGLDQVPTRLTTHPTSRSNTPSKEKVSKKDSDHF